MLTSPDPLKNGVKGVIYPLGFYWTQVQTKRYNYNRWNCQIGWQKYLEKPFMKEVIELATKKLCDGNFWCFWIKSFLGENSFDEKLIFVRKTTFWLKKHFWPNNHFSANMLWPKKVLPNLESTQEILLISNIDKKSHRKICIFFRKIGLANSFLDCLIDN